MRITTEMRARAAEPLRRYCKFEWACEEERDHDLDVIAGHVLEAALGPESPRERAQARHITQLERVRAVEQQMWAQRNLSLSKRVHELEVTLSELGKQRRVQRVLRAVANALSARRPAP